jgi:hypothetical protein
MSRRARLLRRYRRILRFIEREEAVLQRPLKLFRQLHDRDVQLIRACHRSRRGMRLR